MTKRRKLKGELIDFITRKTITNQEQQNSTNTSRSARIFADNTLTNCRLYIKNEVKIIKVQSIINDPESSLL